MRLASCCLPIVLLLTLGACKQKAEPPAQPGGAPAPTPGPPKEAAAAGGAEGRVDPTAEGPLNACAREVPALAVSFGDTLPPPAAAALLVRAAKQTAGTAAPGSTSQQDDAPLTAEVVERYREALTAADRQGALTTGQAPLTTPGVSEAQADALDDLVGLLIVPRTLWRASGPRWVRDVIAEEGTGEAAQRTEEAIARLCTGETARAVHGDAAVDAMLANEVIWMRMFVRRVLRAQPQAP